MQPGEKVGEGNGEEGWLGDGLARPTQEHSEGGQGGGPQQTEGLSVTLQSPVGCDEKEVKA